MEAKKGMLCTLTSQADWEDNPRVSTGIVHAVRGDYAHVVELGSGDVKRVHVDALGEIEVHEPDEGE